MTTTLSLTVVTGPHKNAKFFLDRSGQCLIGRAADCAIRLCGTIRDQGVSRHHCRLQIDPPFLGIQDLGSRNGTFLNGKKVESLKLAFASSVKTDATTQPVVCQGDLLTVGGTTLRIDINCRPGEQRN
jgi:eukaryotic-like serine/threonine-protein kinase